MQGLSGASRPQCGKERPRVNHSASTMWQAGGCIETGVCRMSRFTAYSVELIDPRGRCDRRGLLALAIIIMVLQAALALAVLASGIEPAPLIVDMVNAVFVYMAFAATAKRLHDTGRSAWWIVGGAIAVVAWSIAVAFSAVLALGPSRVVRSPMRGHRRGAGSHSRRLAGTPPADSG